MILFHFTLERYIESIRRDGIIPVAEKSRRGMYPPGFFPVPDMFEKESELVWLTCNPNTNAGIVIDEPIWRITVQADDARRWSHAADKYGVPGWWRRAMVNAALEINPLNHPVNWYVVEGIIPVEDIRVIEAL